MKKEYRAMIKQLKKITYASIRNNAKKYNFKTKQDAIFCVNENMFLSIYIRAGVNENCFICTCQEVIKPLWTDNLLWDILDCPENKNESISLRAFGAFTFFGLETYSEKSVIENWSNEELEICIEKYVKNFVERQKCYNATFFEEKMNRDMYQGDLYNLLHLIHKKKYSDAYDFIDNMDSDRFIIGNDGLRKLARVYCQRNENA